MSSASVQTEQNDILSHPLFLDSTALVTTKEVLNRKDVQAVAALLEDADDDDESDADHHQEKKEEQQQKQNTVSYHPDTIRL
jgi:hypothetical protein